MRHAVVEGVRPDGDATEGCRDGGVVDELLVLHHDKLRVSADAKLWCAHAVDARDVGVELDDVTRAGHLITPRLVVSERPVVGVGVVGDGENTDLVALAVQFLNGRVVGVLV